MGAGTVNYSDSGLVADTSYWYRVNASNPDGTSAYSNVASDTTDPAGTPTSVRVGSITVSTVGVGQGQKFGRAIVVVEDDTGSLVEGAVVTGQFSGTFSTGLVTGAATGSDGSTTFDTTETAKGKVNLDFCVWEINYTGLDDFVAGGPGEEICGSL